MIPIDFSWLIAALLLIALSLVFWDRLFYTFYKRDRKEPLAEKSTVERCPFCTSIFENDRQSRISVCPHCQSFLNRETNYEKNEPSEE